MMRTLLLFSTLLVAACTEASSPPPATSAQPATAEQAVKAKVKFKDGAGRVLFTLRPKDDGAKLVGPKDEEIARLKDKGDDVEVRLPDDTVVAQIRGDAQKLKVLSSTGEERYALKLYDDGDYKLKDASGATLYVLKVKDDGFKIVDGAGAVVAKAKKREDKVKLKDAEGVTTHETKAPISALAIACLAFERLDLPVRIALVHRIERGR